MASAKQTAANRANAQKSTGPRTFAGRAISSLNAIRDNVTGQIVTLTGEELATFEKLKSEQVADLAPQTVAELKLAHAIAWDTWRLDRLRAAEMNIFALAAQKAVEEAADNAAEQADPPSQIDPNLQIALANAQTFSDEAPLLELRSLYEQRMTRSLHKNRTELQYLQFDRKRRRDCDIRQEMLLARFQDLKDLPYEAPAAPTENGFVFSSKEIRAAAERQRNMEAAQYLLNNKAPWIKYGATGSGSPDLFADLPYRTPPDNLPKKVHGVSAESIALRKFYHPEEFDKRRK